MRGLAPLLWRAIGLGSGHSLELRRACEVGGGMAADRVVEAVDVAADSGCGVGACFEGGAPDELGLQRLEERLDHGVVEAVSPPGHGDQDAAGL